MNKTAARPLVSGALESASTHSTALVSLKSESIEGLVEQLLGHAARLGASDVFLCSNEQCVLVQIRHLGVVRPLTVLQLDQGKRVITLLKTRALLDLAERRRPQEGRWIYQHETNEAGETTYDLRVSTIPTAFGEDVSLRLLNRRSALFTLENLGLMREQSGVLGSALESPGGLILFTGPTGSGKTATLYTCLQRLNDGKRKINTIEDPIEYCLNGVRQSQVNPVIGLGFSELLRSVLRQSPDIIMIGEIRDQETASIAIRAANSGHLVLATIHAVAAAGAVQSMRALGVHPHFLATALRAIVAQRLVRTLCTNCRTSFDLADAPHTFDEVAHLLGPGEGKILWAPRGCAECLNTGYAARAGVFEILPISRAIRHLIAEGHAVREIRDAAAKEQYPDFRQAALLKVAQGETSSEEVFRAIPTEHLMAED